MSSIEIKFDEIQSALAAFQEKTATVDDSPISPQLNKTSMPSVEALLEVEQDIEFCIQQLKEILVRMEADAQQSIASLQDTDKNVSQGINQATIGAS